MKVRASNGKNTVDFATLKPGDCFKDGGKLWIKTNFEQDAICLNDGEARGEFCGDMVTPVNAEVQIIN